MTEDKDTFDDYYPIILKEQVDPFSSNSDIDFIEQDEDSYYAMSDDINSNK